MAGAGRRSAAGSRDTDAKDLCGKAIGNSGAVGGHPEYFCCVFARDRVQRGGEPLGVVV